MSEREWNLGSEKGAVDDPLLDCLVALSNYFERPRSPDALRAGLPLEDHRLTPELFPRAAKRAGLSAHVAKRALGKISELLLPAVLLLKNGQASILLAIDEDSGMATVLQAESGMGERRIKLPRLEAEYTGYAIFIRPEHNFDARAPEVLDRQERHWFWGTLVESWRIYRDVLLASFLINSFALASPLFIMNVYDRVVPNNAVETLWVLAIGVATVFGFDLLMRGLRGYFIDVAGKRADIKLSSLLFERVIGLKMSARPASIGGFANNLGEFENIRNFVTSATVTTLIDLPFVVLFLLVIAWIGGPLVFVPLIGIPLILTYGLFVQVPLRRAVENSLRGATEKNATLVETLGGLETIKAVGAEGVQQRRWEDAVAYIARWAVKARLLSTSVVNVAIFFQQLATVAVVAYGVYLISENNLTLGGLIAGVILTGRAMAPMAQVANLTTHYHQTRAALSTLDGIMSLPVERSGDRRFLHRPVLQGQIEFENVTFRYPGQSLPALDDLSLKIKPGEHVAIIGRIGSGKTTVEKMILGLYEPEEGAVRIDGVDVRQLDPAELRRNVGYVPQDVMLFYGSVRDNIVFGSPHVDDETVLRAAAVSGVTEIVEPHPLGYDMPVGERGELLSGGQRQSVALARALLLESPILLLDEPSNSMDNTTEERLKSRLVEFATGRTLVLVTHRASLLDLVDRLIVLDRGKLVADGPKEKVLALLKQGGLRGVGR